MELNTARSVLFRDFFVALPDGLLGERSLTAAGMVLLDWKEVGNVKEGEKIWEQMGSIGSKLKRPEEIGDIRGQTKYSTRSGDVRRCTQGNSER